MAFSARRLYGADLLVGVLSLLLLIDLVALPWYGLNNVFGPTAASLGERTTATGWTGLIVLGPVILLIALLGLGSVWAAGALRAPAVPVSGLMLTLTLATLAGVALVVRVAIDPPSILIPGAPGVPAVEALYGAWAGLVLTLGLGAACAWALRREAGGPAPAERLQLRQPG